MFRGVNLEKFKCLGILFMSDDGTGDGQKDWGFLCSNASTALVSCGEERVEPSAKLSIYLSVIQGELKFRASASPHQQESVEVVRASGQDVPRGNPSGGFPTDLEPRKTQSPQTGL